MILGHRDNDCKHIFGSDATTVCTVQLAVLATLLLIALWPDRKRRKSESVHTQQEPVEWQEFRVSLMSRMQ